MSDSPTRRLGRSDLVVSALGFGAWAIGGNRFGNSYGSTDDRVSIEAIARARDLGCTFFDTADVYGHGHSETLLGRALRGVRARVVIATKAGGNFYARDIKPAMRARIEKIIGQSLDQVPPDSQLPVTHDANFTPGYLRFACEQSLRRLGTDYIDLLQLHNPAPALLRQSDAYDELERLRTEGKIRAFGVSVHSPEEGLAVIEAGRAAAVQIVYNFVRREAAERFFPSAEAGGVGVIVREPLANALLTGKYQGGEQWEEGDIRRRMPPAYVSQMAAVGRQLKALAEPEGLTGAQLALKFALEHSAVSTVIVGTKTAEQAEENFAVLAAQRA